MRSIHVIAIAIALACHAQAAPREVLVGGPCEGCELVFEGRPARLTASARIAPASEPGDPLVIDGVVRDLANRPVPGVIVYAYQTNARGVYLDASARLRHGRLRGFARTDERGAYRFHTIRPGAYPDRAEPEHVHLHVVEPGRCHYYLDDLVFTDDPRLTAAARSTHERGRSGKGTATPTRDPAGAWHVRRDITLGAGIHDYDRCR
jgi:protocatechuate 3,4-dioxygenase, beta subunit